jgi:hypothetical protein
MVMSKMSGFCTRKMVVLLDSSGNNPVKAERIEGTPTCALESLPNTKNIKSRGKNVQK